MNERMKALEKSIIELIPELTDIYKDFHQNPELSMQEFRTAKKVAEYLRPLGYEIHEKIGITGIVALLSNGAGSTVMLRADMDALPYAFLGIA